MFLEYWQIGILFLVFLAGMIHSSRQASKQQIQDNLESLLDHLEEQGFVKFAKVIKSEDEIEYKLLRPTAFEDA